MGRKHFARAIRCLAAAGLLCGLSATPMSNAAAAPVVRVGVIRIVCTLTTGANVAKGASLSFTASAQGSGLDASQTVSINATVTKSANPQTVTLELPYKWTFTAPGTNVPIRLDVSDGLYPNEEEASTNMTIPMPADGATTTIAIPARF